MSTTSSLKSIENKPDAYEGKYCMRKFCEFLRDYTRKIINSKKKTAMRMHMKLHMKMQ